EPSEHLLAGAAALALPLADEVDDLDDRLLAVAERVDVDEVSEGIGIEGTGAAADDERMRIGALFGEHRQAAEVEHVEYVCVGALVAQREADRVELRERVTGLEAPEREAFGAHDIFHVGPGGE